MTSIALHGQGATARRQATAGRVTMTGLLLGACLLMLIASTLPWARVPVGSLALHPYLLVLAPGIPAAFLRLQELDARLRTTLFLFFVGYCVTLIEGGALLQQGVKVTATILTLVFSAIAIRTRRDYEIAVLCLTGAVAIISLRGIVGFSGDLGGANPLEGVANKNGFSMYALPAILIGAHYFVRPTHRLLRAVVAGFIIVILVAIFMTANRSGWLGAVTIGGMLMVATRDRRAIGAAVVLVLAGYGAAREFGSADVVENRWQQTVDGYHSDDLRQELFFAGLETGLEHPLLGVSHSNVDRELGLKVSRSMHIPFKPYGPHNVFGYLAAGSGYIVLGLLFAAGAALWRGAPRSSARSNDLVRMMVVLFCVRGMFADEILYSPTFAIAFGIGLAYSRLTGVSPVAAFSRASRIARA